MSRRITALAAGAVLAAALAVTGTLTARATTGTCTNIATPISAPIGCGGLYFAGLGSGIQPNGTSLALTASSASWNAHVADAIYDPARSDQDWTVYQRCLVLSGPRSAAFPCGTLGTAAEDPDGQAEFTAEFTPLGHHIGGVINSTGNLCLSVEGVLNGPGGALRWRDVLRWCHSNGAVFTAGFPDGSSGVTGVVTSPNPWQTWSPFGPVGDGFVFANNMLSGNAFNHPFVLDVPGASHVPGAWLLAYPENDKGNQVGRLAACTGAPNQITPGHFDCP